MRNKIFAILIATLMVVALCITLCACNDKVEEPVTATVQPRIVLASARRSVVRNGVEYPAIEIVASINTPYDAGDENLVTWSASWVAGSPLQDEPVSNYITVTQTAIGSYTRTATVVCLQSFRDNFIVVTAATSMGYSASCSVQYNGVPSELSVTDNSEGYVQLLDYDTFQISLDNIFHDVGDEYISKVKVVSYEWGGSYYGATRSINTRTGVVTDTNVDTYDINSLKGGVKDYISVTAENGILRVENFQNLVGAYQRLTTSSEKNTYSKYVISDIDIYVDIILSCGNATTTFRVNFESPISGITLDNAEIVF